jgi:hypothetical protein
MTDPLTCPLAITALPGMATLQANSARESLVKMCTLPLLAGENSSSQPVLPVSQPREAHFV